MPPKGKKRKTQPQETPEIIPEIIPEIQEQIQEQIQETIHHVEEVVEEQRPSDPEVEGDDGGRIKEVDSLPFEIQQELAEFFESHPIFYDKQRSDFKLAQKKDRLLQNTSSWYSSIMA